ncbi:MAG: hypothetical protein ACXABG_17130, partial [Promethearchaeota archaeon]
NPIFIKLVYSLKSLNKRLITIYVPFISRKNSIYSILILKKKHPEAGVYSFKNQNNCRLTGLGF